MPQDEVGTVKERLIGLMISSPPSIQSQLGEATSIIADSDFWRRWDTLTQVGVPLDPHLVRGPANCGVSSPQGTRQSIFHDRP